jgi:5-methylcytosine-specific restriction endonuclease McrA
MIKITITQEIQDEYVKTIKQVLLTPKTKKFTVKTTRFYTFLKNELSINRYSQVFNLLTNHDIHNLIRQYRTIPTDEKNYDIYNDFRKEWANKLVTLTNVKVCPYCNRNFIVNFNKRETTVELDHFFPKSKYPYLAISLYNLIPSCHTCNHKKDNKKLKIYPYTESINDYVKFSFKLNKLPFSLENIDLLTIKKKNTRRNRKKINNYEKVLNISTLYANHKDIIIDLIQKEAIYNESYLDELLTQYEGTLFKNREDLQRIISGGYVSDEEIGKRPLSKLVKDISDELGLK